MEVWWGEGREGRWGEGREGRWEEGIGEGERASGKGREKDRKRARGEVCRERGEEGGVGVRDRRC